jgi:hypothetical protein
MYVTGASFVIAQPAAGSRRADLAMPRQATRHASCRDGRARAVAAIDAGDHPLRANKKWRRWIEEHVDKAASRSVREHDFPKLTTIKDGQVRIKDNPPLIFHHTETGATAFHHMVKRAFHRYRSTLIDERRALLDRYEVTDVAAKVVGVGSVGTRCGIVLLMARDTAADQRESAGTPQALIRRARAEAGGGEHRFGWTDDGIAAVLPRCWRRAR